MTANVTLCTAPSPGAIGLIQIHGSSARAIVEQLTGVCKWPIGRTRLVRFADIDRGLAVRLTEHTFQLMPHSGPRVVRDLLAALDGLGATGRASGPGEIYPEAKSDLEADLLGALAAAASPAAVDLLLDQPVRWRRWLDHPERWDTTAVLEHSAVLDRLLDPPTVVVVGKPNVGKSTLLNRLVGRTASVVADLPGTTRDWVGSLVELIAVSNHDEGARGAVAVRWLDTPGIRSSSDPVEGEALRIAHRVIGTADLLIAMRDPRIGWLDGYPGGRDPGLWVMNKADTLGTGDGAGSPDGRGPQSPLNISAKTGAGLDLLQRGIIERLGLGSIAQDVPWAFSGTLKACVGSGDQQALAFYMGPG